MFLGTPVMPELTSLINTGRKEKCQYQILKIHAGIDFGDSTFIFLYFPLRSFNLI